MPKRSWKVIESHPNYKVSSMGDVLNIRTGQILNPYDDGSGYLRVKLDGRCERLHILVAVAFLDKPEGKDIVNHKRGKKHDCRASQLEWVTQQENIQHAWNTGLCSRGGGKTKWHKKNCLKTRSSGGLNRKVSMQQGVHRTRSLFLNAVGT